MVGSDVAELVSAIVFDLVGIVMMAIGKGFEWLIDGL